MKAIGTYSFLPWLRSGVANTIASADGDPAVKTRASIHVTLNLAGDPVGGGAELNAAVAHDVALYGPGDIVGIDARAIVRTEPRPWITNFEANYLAAIDFYDEDFPWRYTPAAPDAGGLKLRPWLALVVLAAGEFADGKPSANRPLPFITVADASAFPPADQLWAWAHVHFNQSLAANATEVVSPDMNAILPRVEAILNANPDNAYSRIMSPRRLADNTTYHAFLVPTFETGRLAGLGSAPDAAPHATFSAWAAYGGKAEPANYPIYYRWEFKTGSHGDFEYLVRLLTPQPVDKRVGTRDVDVQDPGSNLPGITDPKLHGVLKLGGALRVPDADLNPDELKARQDDEEWDEPYPHPFQTALAKFIDLRDDYAAQAAQAANVASGFADGTDDDKDPLITAPLYGRWHALTQRLMVNRDGTPAPNPRNWIHELNLDPRFRIPAGFGTDVVETNAESYMNAAWEQIGDVLEANRRIRRLQVAREVSWRWYDRHLTPLAAANGERAFALTAPVARRVMSGGVTIAYAQARSIVPPVYTSTALRRVMRPQARLMRSLPFDATATPTNLLARVNAGAVSAAPPKTVPPGVPTVDTAAAAADPKGAPSWVLDLLRRYPWLPLAVLGVSLAIAFLLLLTVIGIVIALVVAGGGYYLYRLLLKWRDAAAPAQSIHEQNQMPASVDALPKSPDFVLSDPGSNVKPSTGASDSPTAARFKTGLRDTFTLFEGSKTVAPQVPPAVLDVGALTATMVTAVDPQVTIPKRGLTGVSIPAWIIDLIGDRFGEVMAYPKIDLPMYEPLKGISAELFLPNINLIAHNSITLIETNQRFIESYMVGLNHEFARKLLWREYPTDQRGSYFRQFWDVRTLFNSANLDDKALKEKLYDIPELHRWAPESNLGDHNNRATQKGEEAVLVIRGELLKKYPTAVIYAHRAKWERKADGVTIDTDKPRTLENIDAAFEDHPPTTIVRTPLYEAKVDPDIYFFGFDLTIPEAKGGDGTKPTDDPGWFFVIKERPGEPRFGLELSRGPSLEVFDELTWDDAVANLAPGAFLPATSLAAPSLAAPPAGDPENKKPQHDDDAKADAAQQSSARWAYLLYRAPIMVAVHADEMLSPGGS
ncbi:MAG TPA: hypothetical protein VGX96_11170 [Candidatus Elarobacter sp.]|nr:hypothetical protein [Candidatus Elarobacter sp.]